MADEGKYILDCPHCGEVSVYAEPDIDTDDPSTSFDPDAVMEEEYVETSAGPTRRCRCPRCGKWVSADRVSPA